MKGGASRYHDSRYHIAGCCGEVGSVDRSGGDEHGNTSSDATCGPPSVIIRSFRLVKPAALPLQTVCCARVDHFFDPKIELLQFWTHYYV